MVTRKIIYSALTALLLMAGCGSSDNGVEDKSGTNNASNNDKNTTIKVTQGIYQFKVVNNMGEAVHAKVGNYDIALYSDTKEGASDKSPHKGVVVKLNNQESKLMPIQATYLNKDIVAKVYEGDKEVSKSEVVRVTDDEPVVLIETEI